jgi:uncharacterized membrane protein YhaH (DUF805 family)
LPGLSLRSVHDLVPFRDGSDPTECVGVTETNSVRVREAPERSARRAWVAVALTPVGLLAGLAVAYAVAAVIGVTLDPATGPGPTLAEKAVVFSIAGLVWLAAPIATVLLAFRPARSGNRSGIAALVVGVLLLVAMLALTITNVTT